MNKFFNSIPFVVSALGIYVSSALPAYRVQFTYKRFEKMETKRVGVVVMTDDQKKIEAIKNEKDGPIVRTTKNGAAVYLLSCDGIHYVIPPALRGGEVRMNLTEGKDVDNLVTVVCTPEGEPVRAFWQKGKKNQMAADREIDARFSVQNSACTVTLNSLGLLLIARHSMKVFASGNVEISRNEFFSLVLKKHGGKFVFSPSMFSSSPGKACFKAAICAAIAKANSRDGAGPTYVEDKSDFRHGTETMTVAKQGDRIVYSGGMTMVSGGARSHG